MSLVEILLKNAPAELKSALARDDSLSASLAAFTQTTRAAWPGLSLGDEAFVAHVAARLSSGPGALERLCGADLFLACACIHGIPGAIAACEARYAPLFHKAAARVRVLEGSPDDFLQELRQKLFLFTT